MAAMTKHRRRLVQLLVRFDNAYDAMEERLADEYDRDSAFDGGEFSGPALRRQSAREGDRIAQRLGFASAGVADDIGAQLGVPRMRRF